MRSALSRSANVTPWIRRAATFVLLAHLLAGDGFAANWTHRGFDAQRTSFNPDETALGPSNVGSLEVTWTNHVPCTINSGVSVVDDIVYYGHYCGEFRAVDAATGTTLWVRNINRTHTGQAIVDGVAYVTARCTYSSCGEVYAFDALTGATLWTWSPGARQPQNPVVEGGVVVVHSGASGDFVVNALDASTGSELWSASPGGNAAIADGIVYVATKNPDRLDARTLATGELLWTGITGSGPLSWPVVSHGIVYVHSQPGELYAFDASGCGEGVCEPIWTGLMPADPNEGAQPPAIAYGKVYVGSANGFYAFDANGCTTPPCLPVWTTTTSCSYFPDQPPAVANGVVYSACDKYYVYAFGGATGSVLWQYYTAGSGYPMRSSPAVVDGRLFHPATFDFNLYAFEPEDPVPVLLSGFTAAPQDRTVRLSWFTSYEDTHDGFNVYRSGQAESGYAKLNGHLIREYEYLDRTVDQSTTYYYRLGDVGLDGRETLHPPTIVTTPAWRFRTALSLASPSPFLNRTTLRFSLAAPSEIRLAIYDVGGRPVRVLVQEELPVGEHTATWDGRDSTGLRVAAGAYFANLTAGDVTQTRKIVYLGGK